MLHGTNINKLPWESISAAVAQMVERMALNHVVVGSIPVGGFCCGRGFNPRRWFLLSEVVQLLSKL